MGKKRKAKARKGVTAPADQAVQKSAKRKGGTGLRQDEFAAHLRRRGYSDRTVTDYARSLDFFRSWLGKSDLVACAPDDIRQFQQWLSADYRSERDGRTLTLSSQVRILAAVRAYYVFLRMEGRVFADPCRGLVPIRVPRALPRSSVTPAMVQTMVRTRKDEPVALRDRAMVYLLAVSGLRASELAALTLDDVDLEAREVHVRHGKGDKDRITFLTPEARTVLAKYLANSRPQLRRDKGTRFFLSKSGRPMTRHLVYHSVRDAAKAAGLGVHVYTHQLRHFFCTVMLKGGADIRTISELAGHERLSTTSRYTKVDDRMLAKTYRDTHPRGA